jgi:hypothetical protein
MVRLFSSHHRNFARLISYKCGKGTEVSCQVVFLFLFPPLLVVFLRSDRKQSTPGELVLLRRISNLVLYLVDLCMDKKGDDAGHAEVDIYTDKFSVERIPRLQSRWRADPARLGVNAEEILFHKVCYQFISHIAPKEHKHRHLEFPLHLCCLLIECIQSVLITMYG